LKEILKIGVMLCRSHQVGNFQQREPYEVGNSTRRAAGANVPTVAPCASRKVCSFRKIKKSLRVSSRERWGQGLQGGL
jgi:hypothetical protein